MNFFAYLGCSRRGLYLFFCLHSLNDVIDIINILGDRAVSSFVEKEGGAKGLDCIVRGCRRSTLQFFRSFELFQQRYMLLFEL